MCVELCLSSSAYSDLTGLQTILCQLESLAVPTIAILNGTTLGGGLEIALACDFRIADSALCRQIGLPEVKIGVLPGNLLIYLYHAFSDNILHLSVPPSPSKIKLRSSHTVSTGLLLFFALLGEPFFCVGRGGGGGESMWMDHTPIY